MAIIVVKGELLDPAAGAGAATTGPAAAPAPVRTGPARSVSSGSSGSRYAITAAEQQETATLLSSGFAKLGDVQGAYGHNACALCPGGLDWLWWKLFCFCCPPRKLWYASSHCDGDGLAFSEEWRSEHRALRAKFEQELMGRAMRDRLLNAPDRGCGPCCGGCSNMEAQAKHLNATWVPRVNAALLAPAGLACVAHYWRHPSGCQCEQHVSIVIVKGAVLDPAANETRDAAAPAEAGGGAAATTGPAAVHTGPLVTLPVSRGLPAAAVVPVVTGPASLAAGGAIPCVPAATAAVSVAYQPAVATQASSRSVILL